MLFSINIINFIPRRNDAHISMKPEYHYNLNISYKSHIKVL